MGEGATENREHPSSIDSQNGSAKEIQILCQDYEPI